MTLMKPLALCVALGLAAGAALASDDKIALTDDTRAQITKLLSDQGYDVGKIKTDDGMYEAYVRKDGKRYEVYLDAGLKIVRTEEDD